LDGKKVIAVFASEGRSYLEAIQFLVRIREFERRIAKSFCG